MKKVTLFIVIILSMIFLMGCATSPSGVGKDAGPYPDNYKELVVGYLRPMLYDPYSLKIERLDPPKILTINRAGCLSPIKAGDSVWAGHFIYNAKNRLGGYVGFQHKVYMIQNGRLIVFGPAKLHNID